MAVNKANIDWEFVKEAITKGSSIKTIAYALGIDRDTLYNRCKKDLNTTIAALSAQYKRKGIQSIEAKAYDMAMEGDKTMTIFWLKCKAKWDDGSNTKNQVTVNNNQPINFHDIMAKRKGLTGEQPSDAEATS